MLTPLFIIRDFFYFIRSAFQNGYMIRTMVIRDMKTRYVGSFLGLFWSIVHPLTQIILYYLVFSVIMKIKPGPEYGGVNFSVWLVSGLLPWLFFAEVVSRSPMAVLDQKHLITKTVFPSEILPLVHLISAAMNHLIAMTIFIGLALVFGTSISLNILFFVPFLFILSAFALGISWLLSALNVFLRDMGQIVGVLINVWFFLTPIMYPYHFVPQSLQEAYNFNPMLHLVEGYRWALLGRTSFDLGEIPYVLTAVTFTFAIGALIFKKLKPAFADVL